MCETWVQSLGWEDPLEKGRATNSGILDWRIPWKEEPGTLQSMRSQRVRHTEGLMTHTEKRKVAGVGLESQTCMKPCSCHKTWNMNHGPVTSARLHYFAKGACLSQEILRESTD